MESAAELLRDYLNNVINDPEHAFLDLQKLPDDFHAFGKELTHFAVCVAQINALAKAMSKGKLEVELPPPSNEMASPLKALHSSLKHLAWQAQQIAKGDYGQHVDFMGDFAEAFNTMIAQLEDRRATLLAQIEVGRQKTTALEQSNRLLKAITDKIHQWVIVIDDATFEWLYVNQQAVNALVRTECGPQIRHWITQQAKTMTQNVQPYSTQIEMQNGDGLLYFTVEVHPLNWYGKSAIAFMLIDISTEREHLYNLQTAAYTDISTQLYNRRYGMKILDEWLVNGKSFVLCFVDIDNLKYVNDNFGHAEGDHYIMEVAEALRDFSCESILCRLGGDEFMILAQGWTVSKATEQMEILRNSLACCPDEGMCNYDRRISYGIVEIGTTNILSASDILRIADEKMYEDKRRNKAECKIVQK